MKSDLATYIYQFKVEVSFSNTILVCSGGLRIKRDITEYGDFVRSFNAPSVDEKFELLGMYVVNSMLLCPVHFLIEICVDKTLCPFFFLPVWRMSLSLPLRVLLPCSREIRASGRML